MDEPKKPTLKQQVKKHWFTGSIFSIAGSWFAFDPLAAKEFLNEALQHDITRYTIAFIIAWKIVKRDMKRDMAEEFTGLKFEISKLGDGFKKVAEDLKAHSDRLDRLDDIVKQLKALIEKIVGGGLK